MYSSSVAEGTVCSSYSSSTDSSGRSTPVHISTPSRRHESSDDDTEGYDSTSEYASSRASVAQLEPTPEDRELDIGYPPQHPKNQKVRKQLQPKDLKELKAENESLRKRNSHLVDQIEQQLQNIMSRLLNLPVGVESGQKQSSDRARSSFN